MKSARGVPHIDKDIEEALEQRERSVRSMVDIEKEQHAEPWRVQAFAEMLSSQIIVWEPDALEEFGRFWLHPKNERIFSERCLIGGNLRYISSLLEPAYHFFPAGGFYAPPDYVFKEHRDPLCMSIFRPDIRSISIGTPVKSRPYIPTFVQTACISPAKFPLGRWKEIKSALALTSPRDRVHNPFMNANNQSVFLVIENGTLRNQQISIDWVGWVYQLRLFLEQPFLGLVRFKHREKSRSTGQYAEHDIVKILMREAPKTVTPKLVLPEKSRLNGRPLEFEVEVREHVRHCASGLVTKVKAHKRGLIGVKRPRVIKVIR